MRGTRLHPIFVEAGPDVCACAPPVLRRTPAILRSFHRLPDSQADIADIHCRNGSKMATTIADNFWAIQL